MKSRLALLCVLTLLLVPLAPLPALGASTAPAPAAPTLAQPGPGTAPADRAAEPSAFDPLYGVMPAHTHAPGTAAHAHAAAPLDAASPAGQGRPKSAGLCGPRLVELPDADRCSHGPDPAPPGFSIARDVAPVSAAVAAADTPRANCVNDGASGNRVQVLYTRAADVPSRFGTFLPSIRVWADDVNLIFQESAAETGGTRAVRYLHDQFCNVVVSEVVLSATGDDNINNTIADLTARGFSRADRKYMIFMDANMLCGQGTIWNTDTSAAGNRNNIGPDYGRTDAGCWGGEVAAHELMHNLGGVQLSAPNDSGGWHCVDEWDRMCYSDAGPNLPPMRIACGSQTHDRLFDCNHDDYYHTNPPAGSYLATHWNAANNSFLAGGIPPPVCPDRAIEPDNTPSQAHNFVADGTQIHAFCSTNDVDWVVFNGFAFTHYRIETLNIPPGVDTVLELYASDGTTLLASNDDRFAGTLTSLIEFDATTSGPLYVKTRNFGGTPGSHVFGYHLSRTTTSNDTTPPTAPALTLVEAPNTPNQHVVGQTVYLRPGSTQSAFSVSAVTSDLESGISIVSFTDPFDTVFPITAFHDEISPYNHRYIVPAGTPLPSTMTGWVSSRNGVSLGSPATSFSLTPDAAKPTLAITAPAAGAHITTPSTVLRATASDGGAGVASVAFRRCRTGTCVAIGTDMTVAGAVQYSVVWNVATLPAGIYTIQVVATDHVGNATALSRNLVVE